MNNIEKAIAAYLAMSESDRQAFAEIDAALAMLDAPGKSELCIRAEYALRGHLARALFLDALGRHDEAFESLEQAGQVLAGASGWESGSLDSMRLRIRIWAAVIGQAAGRPVSRTEMSHDLERLDREYAETGRIEFRRLAETARRRIGASEIDHD